MGIFRNEGTDVHFGNGESPSGLRNIDRTYMSSAAQETPHFLRLVSLVALFVFLGCGENERSDGEASEDVSAAAENARVDERTAALAEKKGGLPMEMALSRATTEKQKQRIRDRLAYRSQTREDAAARAMRQQADIEKKLLGDLSDEERAKLERQAAALRRIISDLR